MQVHIIMTYHVLLSYHYHDHFYFKHTLDIYLASVTELCVCWEKSPIISRTTVRPPSTSTVWCWTDCEADPSSAWSPDASRLGRDMRGKVRVRVLINWKPNTQSQDWVTARGSGLGQSVSKSDAQLTLPVSINTLGQSQVRVKARFWSN